MLKNYHYALFVFLGACSYGVISSIIKLAYADGFLIGEVIISQYFFGWFILLLLTVLFSRLRISFNTFLLLIAAGTTSSLTGIFYSMSLQTIPASIAIILLFQFTWIGIFIESIVDRRLPSREKVLSVVSLLIGTLLASGWIGSSDVSSLSIKGTLLGLLSGLTFALFIFFSGRIQAKTSFLMKGLSMATGAFILVLICFPPTASYYHSLLDGLWKYSILLGLFGVAIPVTFFGLGSPKIGSGLATILGGAELPTAIIASILLLKEKVSVIQWIGVIFILLGICVPTIYQYVSRRRMLQET